MITYEALLEMGWGGIYMSQCSIFPTNVGTLNRHYGRHLLLGIRWSNSNGRANRAYPIRSNSLVKHIGVRSFTNNDRG